MTIFTTSIAQRLFKLIETTLGNIQYSYVKNDITILNTKLKGDKVKSGFYKARERMSKRFVSISKAQKELKTYIRKAEGFETENTFSFISNESIQKFENILKMHILNLETYETLLKNTLTFNRNAYGFNMDSIHQDLTKHRNLRKKLIEVRVALNDFKKQKKIYDNPKSFVEVVVNPAEVI